MLMIPGTIEAESEFEVIQRNLTMTYTGGQGISVSPGQESPAAVLSHVRIAKHEISIITLNSSGSDPEFEGDVEDVMFILDAEGGYQPVEFVLSVVYLGHEPFDSFMALGGVAGTDGNDWSVEFHNGSGEWNDTTLFDLGLEHTTNFSNLHVRVNPANQSTAHSFEDGHTITCLLYTSDAADEL